MITRTRILNAAAAFSLMFILILTTPAAVAQRVANNVPGSIRQASDLGRIDPAKESNITVQLKMQNQAAFDKELEALYDSASPTFHKWLTDEEPGKVRPGEGTIGRGAKRAWESRPYRSLYGQKWVLDSRSWNRGTI
jgi:hypothetical protein